jgi:futalosine hydrolase
MTNQKRILIATAVSAEKEAVMRGLKGNDRFNVIEVGVGPIEAAARTAIALSKDKYNDVISVGIAGGFIGQADIGDIVIANDIIAADLGAQSEDGFISIEKLGFGTSTIAVNKSIVNALKDTLGQSKLNVKIGPILTVSTVTGTSATADALSQQVKNATAEAMEGFGVAMAAKQFNIPTLEIRSISNLVGPRNKSEWKIKEALSNLEIMSSTLSEVL